MWGPISLVEAGILQLVSNPNATLSFHPSDVLRAHLRGERFIGLLVAGLYLLPLSPERNGAFWYFVYMWRRRMP